jgi:hypothetical protein
MAAPNMRVRLNARTPASVATGVRVGREQRLDLASQVGVGAASIITSDPNFGRLFI